MRLSLLALGAGWLAGCSSNPPAPIGGSGAASGGYGGGAGEVAVAGAGAELGSGGGGDGGAMMTGGVTNGGVTNGGAAGASGASGTAGTAGTPGQGGAGGVMCRARPFVLTSSAFDDGGPIAEEYRCTGENVTPPLEWSCGPAGTKSYALTQIHVGSQTLHWALFDVPASVSQLSEGIARQAMPPIPAGSKQVEPNVDGSTWYGYSGPCPGSANQSYTFFAYALDVETLPGVSTESTAVEVDTAIKAHDLAVATLTGTASKP